MPVKLSIGVSRKVGQPNYGSVGAVCQIESELDALTLEFDLDSLHQRIRDSYEICSNAVAAELTRQTEASAAQLDGVDAGPKSNGSARNGRRRGNRPATPAQLRAIRAIEAETGQDLHEILSQCFSKHRVEDLTVREASHLIDILREAAQAASREN